MAPFIAHNDTSVVPLWTNNTDQPITTLIPVINAAQNKTVHYAASATLADAEAAIAAAAAAFETWSLSPLPQRRDILLKAADLLHERAEELDAMQSLETSSPPTFGREMAKGGAATVKELACLITTACAGDLPHVDPGAATSMITRHAIGPVLLISPWNGPTYLGPRGIASALAAGCTTVLKASELCPALYRLMCQVFADAGLPAGVLNQIVVRREDAAAITEAIIADRRIRKVEFIGSAAVGSVIGALCGKYLKPIIMELGGKCPAIICRDADLRAAAQACAFGAYLHHGQICMSTDRIIVVKDVAEEFTRYLEEETMKWAAMPSSAATKAFADKAHDAVADAVAKGAKLIVGDNSYRTESGLQPTVLTNITREAKLFDEESFGPIATLIVVGDEEEALQVANSSSYGLNGCIWSGDRAHAISLARRMDGTIININGSTVVTDIPPTSYGQAVKGSGWGVVNGVPGIREFLVPKVILSR